MTLTQQAGSTGRRAAAALLALAILSATTLTSCGSGGSASPSIATTSPGDGSGLLASSCSSLQAALSTTLQSGPGSSSLMVPTAKAKGLEDTITNIITAAGKRTLDETLSIQGIVSMGMSLLLRDSKEGSVAMTLLKEVRNTFLEGAVIGATAQVAEKFIPATVTACQPQGLSTNLIDQVLLPPPVQGELLPRVPWDVALHGSCQDTQSAANPVDRYALEAARCAVGSLPSGSNLGTDSPAIVGDVAYLGYGDSNEATFVLQQIAGMNRTSVYSSTSGDPYVTLGAGSFISLSDRTLTLSQECVREQAGGSGNAIGLMWVQQLTSAQQTQAVLGLVFDCSPWTSDRAALRSLALAHDYGAFDLAN